jgi:small multidrug resistance pump
MGYALLAGAIGAEIATTATKYSDGFTRPWPALLAVAGCAVSYALLSGTLKSLEVGTAYAIRAGAGTAVTAAIGTVFLHGSASPVRVAGIALALVVLGGVVVLSVGAGQS